MIQQDILLSVCIPTYNRSVWFARALRSVVANIAKNKNYIEVIISDDSDYNECRAIASLILQPLNIIYQYVYNQPRLGMSANWNYAIQLAAGKYILVLHDDDFLLNNAIDKILKIIKNNQEQYPVMLFGVHVVTEQEKVIKKQLFKRKFYLHPTQALIKILSNSSFVRFPGIVIRKDIFQEVGYFDTAIGEVADLDMWTKLFSKFGVICLPNTISAYTVHSNALTTQMFNLTIIKQLQLLFFQIEKMQILPVETIKKSQTDFLHQFILAGTYRQLRSFKFQEAATIIKLFNTPNLKSLPISLKWLLVKISFSIILAIYNLFCLIKASYRKTFKF